MAKSSTFTIRVNNDEQETLRQLAELRGMTVSNLTRELIRQGIKNALDPDEIDRIIDMKRNELHTIAERVRANIKERGATYPDNPAP